MKRTSARPIEGDGRGIHHLGDEGLDVVIGVDFENRDGNFLAARAGKCDVNIAFGIEGGAGHGMKIFSDGNRDLHGVRIADVPVGGDHDGTGGCAFGNTRDQKAVGADDDGSFEVAKFHFGAMQFMGTQSGARNAEFASGEGAERARPFQCAVRH